MSMEPNVKITVNLNAPAGELLHDLERRIRKVQGTDLEMFSFGGNKSFPLEQVVVNPKTGTVARFDNGFCPTGGITLIELMNELESEVKFARKPAPVTMKKNQPADTSKAKDETKTDVKPKKPAGIVVTPIALPTEDYNDRIASLMERGAALVKVIGCNERGEEVVKFTEATVALKNCRIIGDLIVNRWERGTGHRLDSALKWLTGQIRWEERRMKREKNETSIHRWQAKVKEEEPKQVYSPAPQKAPIYSVHCQKLMAETLVAKRSALRQEIQNEIDAAIDSDNTVLFEKLTCEMEERVRKVQLSAIEMGQIEQRSRMEETVLRMRDPNFGAMKVAAPKEKIDGGKKNGKGGKKTKAA